MKTKFIVANWKENPEKLETVQKLLQISENFHSHKNTDTHYVITHAVPNIFVGYIKEEHKNADIILQNISCFESGSHTGEISATQAKGLGINMSIVGHSETRLSTNNPKGDEDKQINQKIKNLLSEDMWALLCVGEYKRENFDYKKYISDQITNCLDGVSDVSKMVLAYEPIWAIGKDAVRPATSMEISETLKFIKQFVNEKFHIDIKVLYGGSVDENNAKKILDLDEVDGVLIGRASSDPEKWERLLENLRDESKQKKEITEGTRVLLRLDLNVPFTESGEIANTFRIDESIPTILNIQNKGAKVIILAHQESGSLEKVADYLKTKIDNFTYIKETTPEKIEMNNGGVVLLENVRNDKREKEKDESKRGELGEIFASYGDVFINDAFSSSHREHASITSIPKFLPSELGPNFLREIEKLSSALNPEHPLLLILGGAKFETKLGLLDKFVNIADYIFVGGALAHSFWKAKGQEIGKSLIDEDVKLQGDLLNNPKIFLPVDVVTSTYENKKLKSITSEDKITDFGENTLNEIIEKAKLSKTIIWNGPLGFYEKGFEGGTDKLLMSLGKMTDKKIILGGGDTVAVASKIIQNEPGLKFYHISTGGGAMIDYLSKGTLPGISAIEK